MPMKRSFLFLGVFLFSLAVHAQFRPDDLSGLSLWLRSDTLMTVSATNKVEAWGDAGGSEDGAAQTGSSLQPLLVDNVLAGFPAVRFDGFNDFMLFPERSSIYTVFMVACETESATPNFRSVLGHSSSYHFLRGGAEEIWHIDFVSPGISTGNTRLNFNEIDGTSTSFPYTPALLSVASNEPLAANQLSVDRGFYSRVWQGDWFELIVYDWALSESEIAEVENYLADRYMPSFVALDAVENTTLCDTTLCAPDGFAQYVWNGIAGDQCYTATDSEQLLLEVVDGFGRVTSQIIPITFPGNSAATQSTICSGESLELDSELDPTDYELSWTGASTDQTLEVSESGWYFYTATDALGCLVERGPWEIQVNDFGLTNALEDTVHVCAGQLIAPMNVQLSEVDIVWNETLVDSVLLAEISAWNYVEMVDAGGCVLLDSTYANVVGQAPDVHVSVTGSCQGDVVDFTETAGSDSPISSWMWTVNGTEQEAGANLSMPVNAWGDVPFTLWVETLAGCAASLDSTFQMKPFPVVDLAIPQLCQYSDFSVTPLVDLPQGAVAQIYWDVDGVLLAQDVLLASVEQQDSMFLSVQVVSDAGCMGTVDTTLFFLTSPNPTFNTSQPHCAGSEFSFNSFLNCPDCPTPLIYNWIFDDGNFSSQENPNHFYVSEGEYDVTLQVATPAGCVGSWTKVIGVYAPPPGIAIEYDLPCSGVPITLYDQTLAATGNYDWLIEGQAVGSQWSSQVTHTFEEPGTYLVGHQAGIFGCTAWEEFIVEILQGADPGFTVSASAPPLDYQLIPAVVQGTHVWDWGAGSSTTDTSPVVSFEEETYTISHTHVALNSCEATAALDWEVEQIETNIAVAGLQLLPGPAGNLQLHALVVNTSNHPISAVALQAGTESDAGFWEWHALALPAGEHEWVALGGEIPNVQLEVVCVNVKLELPALSELTLEDNRWCESFGASAWSLPYPNPAVGGFYIDVFLEAHTPNITIELIDALGRVTEIWSGDLVPGYQNVQLSAPQVAGGQYQLIVRKAGEIENRFSVVLLQPGG